MTMIMRQYFLGRPVRAQAFSFGKKQLKYDGKSIY